MNASASREVALTPIEVSSQRRSILEAALQSLNIGIVVHDSLGCCILANSAALNLSPISTTDFDVSQNVETSQSVKRLISDELGRVITTGVATIVCDAETFYVTTIADITDEYKVEQELLERAYIDALTGLPNRTLIEQHAEGLIKTLKARERFGLAFIDVDNFKQINDYYGHAAGDALLRKVADRILSSLRSTDFLARVGGDEFVLLLAPIPDERTTEALVLGISERLKEPFFVDSHEIFASASIGVSIFPDHGESYDILRRKADCAMYKAKGILKGSVSTFSTSIAEIANERINVEQRLRLAIRDHRFCCAYQPKVDMRTRKVVGVEVLLRWQDDEGTIRVPGDFIALAIELGLINDIAFEVLRNVKQSFSIIDDIFGADVKISVNVAARQACDLSFMSSFVEAIGTTGRADRFMLELTEEAFFAKSRFQADVLPLIRGVGAGVSIDDFGVGFSSLAALAEITADEIKIDRSFITDIHKRPRSQLVLKAIESLGQALGMSIIAEGVESFEEAAYLQAATRIQYAQGYFYARPKLIGQLTDTFYKSPSSRDGTTTRKLLASRRNEVTR